VTNPRPENAQARAEALEASLVKQEKTQPLIRAQIGGRTILDHLLLAGKAQNAVHFPSLATALGSLGGYACQVAARAGLAIDDPDYAGRSIVTVDAATGEQYAIGDAINWPLIERRHSIWALTGSMARKLGATLPDLNELVDHGVTTLGGPDFGQPRFHPGQAANSPPRDWLRSWNAILRMLSALTTDPQQWPIAYGIAVQQLFDLVNKKASGRYDLGAMVRVVMDSAIATSKIQATGYELGGPPE
jgi:hypothetical protein